MKKTIYKSSANIWTIISLILSLGLFVAAITLMKKLWPPTPVFEWFLLPCLLFGSVTGVFTFSLWMISPRKFIFEIENDIIRIIDKAYFKSKSNTIDANAIISINYCSDSVSYIETRDGKRYTIRDVLMMKKKEIFQVLQKTHPHIKCTSDEVNIFKSEQSTARER